MQEQVKVYILYTGTYHLRQCLKFKTNTLHMLLRTRIFLRSIKTPVLGKQTMRVCCEAETQYLHALAWTSPSVYRLR
jgi:hypothetical protein